MRRITTFTTLTEIASSFLNLIQDEIVGRYLGVVGAGATNDFAATTLGGTGISLQMSAVVATGTNVRFDNAIDWRDRILTVTGFFATAATYRIGQSNDHLLNDPTSTAVIPVQASGYTGIGAVSNVTTSATVSSGNPPLNDVGVVRSYAIPVHTFGASPAWAWLYADPISGYLYLYNNTGANLVFCGRVDALAPTELR